ncbi:hypothetical protein Vafri_17159 [Volvox africanus]|uniref:Uncharacterized protein n=1 Tax=Volvox africanus TaxID=51714 RepID=A0A8J4BPP7_9CHLO|nr:hypothetical protein Vafri_17159 [Volvox africanus]
MAAWLALRYIRSRVAFNATSLELAASAGTPTTGAAISGAAATNGTTSAPAAATVSILGCTTRYTATGHTASTLKLLVLCLRRLLLVAGNCVKQSSSLKCTEVTVTAGKTHQMAHTSMRRMKLSHATQA